MPGAKFWEEYNSTPVYIDESGNYHLDPPAKSVEGTETGNNSLSKEWILDWFNQ